MKNVLKKKMKINSEELEELKYFKTKAHDLLINSYFYHSNSKLSNCIQNFN